MDKLWEKAADYGLSFLLLLAGLVGSWAFWKGREKKLEAKITTLEESNATLNKEIQQEGKENLKLMLSFEKVLDSLTANNKQGQEILLLEIRELREDVKALISKQSKKVT